MMVASSRAMNYCLIADAAYALQVSSVSLTAPESTANGLAMKLRVSPLESRQYAGSLILSHRGHGLAFVGAITHRRTAAHELAWQNNCRIVLSFCLALETEPAHLPAPSYVIHQQPFLRRGPRPLTPKDCASVGPRETDTLVISHTARD
jgi:hypothetical protein